MGKPRKPTALLEASGAFAKNPARGRARANEPKPTGALGPPPGWLNKTAVQCWHDLVARVPYPLTNADDNILAATAYLESKLRRGEANLGEIGQYTKCLQQMGMTPSARSNVQVKPTGTGNEFSDA